LQAALEEDMTRASREEILEHVRRAVAELFQIEPERIQLVTKVVEDLDLDSIDAIELAVRMEAMTGQRFDPERFREMRTIGDVVEILYGILNAPEGTS
jgi:acyl carrier protein